MTIDFLQKATDVTAQTTYTFSAQNLGSAVADRYIIVGILVRDSGTGAKTINSVTIGGVTASIVVQQQTQSTNSNIAGIAMALVPSGTTGDVVIVMSEAMARCGIAVYRATGISATPTDFGGSSANNPTYNIDIVAGGFAIGVSTTAATASATWTNLTEDWDEQISFNAMTAAHDTFVGAQTNLAVTATWTSATESAGVFASFAPSAEALTFSVSDTITVTDVVQHWEDTIVVQEYIALSIITGDLSVNVNDTVTVSEAVTMRVVSYPNVSDAVSVAELVATEVRVGSNVSDSITIIESITIKIPTLLISVSESVGVAEEVTAYTEEHLQLQNSRVAWGLKIVDF